MCQWLMKTDNATECGAQCEVFSHGMLRAYFSPDNRIKRLEIVFDVMSFMQQLQRAAGQGEFRMIPNTVRARGGGGACSSLWLGDGIGQDGTRNGRCFVATSTRE